MGLFVSVQMVTLPCWLIGRSIDDIEHGCMLILMSLLLMGLWNL
jgi:hypothetical protein